MVRLTVICFTFHSSVILDVVETNKRRFYFSVVVIFTPQLESNVSALSI